MSLLLVRHGETALNVARTLQPADTPLSDNGRRQAERVARRLAPLGIAAIVSSPLPRATATAHAIAAATGVPVDLLDALQERNFGDLRGQPYDALGFDPLTMADAPAGGESLAAFLRRTDDAWSTLCDRRAALEGTLVVVTHGLVLRAWLDRQLTLPVGQQAPGLLGNTALTVCAAARPHTIDLLACVAHLDEGSAHDGRSLVGG